MKTAVLIAWLVVAGCHPKPADPWQAKQKERERELAVSLSESLVHNNVVVPKYNRDDLSQATMDRMWNKVDHLRSNERYPAATLKAARYKLQCFEDWANTLSDPQVKAAYLFWVGIYASGYDQIEENNKKPAGTAVVDTDEIERQEKQRRADALAIPKPPKAMCSVPEVTR